MTTQLIILVLLGVIAVLIGGAIGHFTQRKSKSISRPSPASNIDAARKRAVERASVPKKQPPPPPTPHALAPVAPKKSVEETPTNFERASRPVSSPEYTKDLPDKDAWENWETHEFNPYTSGHVLTTTIDIHYVDSKGQGTDRQITTERYVHNGHDGLLHAFCHMRRSRRSFRIAQITAASSADTGEIIQHLPTWLDEQYAQSDSGLVDAFIEEHEAALTSLFFIAKADGAFRQPEKALVLDFCEAYGCEVADLVVNTMAQWTVPSKIGYGKALRMLTEQPDDYQLQVYEVATKMLTSKKTPRDAEKAALNRMHTLLAIEDMKPTLPSEGTGA